MYTYIYYVIYTHLKTLYFLHDTELQPKKIVA